MSVHRFEREVGLVAAAGGTAESLTQGTTTDERGDSTCDLGHAVGWDKNAGTAVPDQFVHAADLTGNDRKSGAHGFDDAARKTFPVRYQAIDIGIREDGSDVVTMTEKLDGSLGIGAAVLDAGSGGNGEAFRRHGGEPEPAGERVYLTG